jgi:hypothetical protein
VRNLHDLLLGLRGNAKGQPDGGGQQRRFGMVLHVFSSGLNVAEVQRLSQPRRN